MKPGEYAEVSAYLGGGECVVVGDPALLGDREAHACDAMGCGQEHVLLRLPLDGLRGIQAARDEALARVANLRAELERQVAQLDEELVAENDDGRWECHECGMEADSKDGVVCVDACGFGALRRLLGMATDSGALAHVRDRVIGECIDELLKGRLGREEYGHAKAAVMLDIEALERLRAPKKAEGRR